MYFTQRHKSIVQDGTANCPTRTHSEWYAEDTYITSHGQVLYHRPADSEKLKASLTPIIQIISHISLPSQALSALLLCTQQVAIMSRSQSSDPNVSKAHESDPPLPVYFVWLTDDKAIFVEKDYVNGSGRLMCSFTFLNDPLVGTKHDLSSPTIPEELPTFVNKQLIAYVEPESLSPLDAVCRTVSMLQRSPAWAGLALKEIQSFHLFDCPNGLT